MTSFDDIGDHAGIPPATPAATIIVFRRAPDGGAPQILLVERSGSLSFAGGATVFPGGKVDPADHALAARARGTLDPDDAAGRVAAIREALEETGLVVGLARPATAPITAAQAASARQMLADIGDLAPVLDAFGWELALDQLVPFARWWPRHLTRVFDTRFYLADLGSGIVEVAADATESRHLFWASAQEALRLADEGAISVIYPTRRNLERLALFADFESCRRHALETPVVTITPRIEMRDGRRWLTIPDHVGYPVDGEPVEQARRG